MIMLKVESYKYLSSSFDIHIQIYIENDIKIVYWIASQRDEDVI